jgi:hypothetical protein
MNQSAVDFVYLLETLSGTSTRIQQLIRDFSPYDFRKRNPIETFSALENICHLRDLEIQAYTPRIEQILNETGPALADFDGARVAAENDYNGEEPYDALKSFSLAREQNIQKLKGLSEEQLEREGLLEGVGKVTLRQLAEMMREHDEGHLEDLRVLRERIEL